ncbi:hypothetical protein Hanom_Chr13g01220041 [Helianthus anomalus]
MTLNTHCYILFIYHERYQVPDIKYNNSNIRDEHYRGFLTLSNIIVDVIGHYDIDIAENTS